jgi:hypothetical protein
MSKLGASSLPSATADFAKIFLPEIWKEAESLFDQEYPLDRALLRIVLGAAAMHIPAARYSSSYFTSPPQSCSDFLFLCRSIFSSDFCLTLDARIGEFDALVQANDDGIRLSDAFIQDRSRSDWLKVIIQSISIDSLMRSGELPFPFSIDGTRDDSRGVRQIILRGKDLRTAWVQNRTTSSWHPFENFSPDQPAAPMIFHGTNTRTLTAPNIDDLCCGRVRLFAGGRNQMAPWGVFHTSFFGIRAFLWAVFNQNVVTLDPEGSARLNLNSSFRLNDTEYRGVLLLTFYTQTPSPPNLSTEILDESIMSQWSGQNADGFRPGFITSDERDEHWKKLSSIHGKERPNWPDILHAPEEQRTRLTLGQFFRGQGLLPSTGPIWRSAHCTEDAMQYLRGRVAGAFAVTFEQELPQKETKKKEKQGLTKRVCQWFKRGMKEKSPAK